MVLLGQYSLVIFWLETNAESLLRISGSSKDLSTTSIQEKKYHIRELSRYVHKKGRIDSLYALLADNWTILHAVLSSQIIFYQSRVRDLFVPKFYHDRASTNFLKYLTYLGEIKPENSNSEFKHPGIGRKYYSYKKTDFSTHTFLSKDINWPFRDTYFKSIGLSVRGFQFLLPNLSNFLKSFFQPSANLINTESGTEEITTVLTKHSFYLEQRQSKKTLKNIKMFQQVLLYMKAIFCTIKVT